jgi:hypothetical protein
VIRERLFFFDDADGEFHSSKFWGGRIIGEEHAKYVCTKYGAGWPREDLAEGDEVFAEEEMYSLIEMVTFG